MHCFGICRVGIRYRRDLREVDLWRRIFGLALPLAALLAGFLDGPDAGFLERVRYSVGVSPLSLLIVFVLLGFAGWGFPLQLLGLWD